MALSQRFQRVLPGRIYTTVLRHAGFVSLASSGAPCPSRGSCRVQGGHCGRRRGWTCPCPATGSGAMMSRCSGTGCGVGACGSPLPRPGLLAPSPAVNSHCGSCFQVWGIRDCREGVRSQTLQVLMLVCGGRALVSICDYLNVSTL